MCEGLSTTKREDDIVGTNERVEKDGLLASASGARARGYYEKADDVNRRSDQ